MKKIVLALIVLCFSFAVQAQKVYFIYLQEENRAPFYVRLSDKIFSSSASGFLTLSNLRDSTYTFLVGHPGQKESETRFSIPLEASDKGFLVKSFDGQLGLFDLQTLAVHKPVATVSANEQVKTRTDSFTKLLSQAANDESLLTVPVTTKAETKPKDTKKEEAKTEIKTEEPKTEVATIETKTDSAVATEKKDSVVAAPKVEVKPEAADTLTIKPSPVQDRQVEVNEQETKAETPYLRSTILRKSESSTTEGFGLVFIDVQTTTTDTIRLLIPNPKKAVKVEDASESKNEVEKTALETVSQPETAATEKISGKTNDCPSLASEKDFLKLRKNMAAEDNDEEMISEAKKYFKNRCFTTEQVRHLSTLFLTNAAKYQFFDAAYNHVSDRDQFASLSVEIKDDYYSKRFKALIGN